jgi:hypothetical protein
VAFEVILPVIIGRYLDQRWGMSVWTVVGAVLGPILGFWHLLTLTGAIGSARQQPNENENDP